MIDIRVTDRTIATDSSPSHTTSRQVGRTVMRAAM